MMFKIVLIFLIAFLSLNAQDKASDMIKAVQQKFESINDMTADIKQGGINGSLSFKKENKFRIKIKNNDIISDGSTVWNYVKKENKVIISEYDESDPSAVTINSILNDYPAQSEAGIIRENGRDVLQLIPKPDSYLNFEKVKLWINEESLVEKISIENSASGTLEIELTNYRLNRNLSDSQFTFTPPEGSTVIDLR